VRFSTAVVALSVSLYTRLCSGLYLIFTVVDIFDGDKEPVVYHGKTLTTKVPLRKACEAIAKYAFVVSPYPIIISAEVHCSVPQQDMIALIMREVFGESLVSAPVQDRPRITVLPSPEDLKGRILLKVCLEVYPTVISVQLLRYRRRTYMSRRTRKCS
jgi:phosphatidylinositol-specific phospholipase C-like protein